MTALVFAWSNPYGQPEPLWRFEAESEIPMGGGRLKTAASAAAFINSWYDGAKEAGYVKGTPIIDLTGKLPGALYIIGGILPNVPWLGSGYPGSETGAALVLSRIPCPQLAQAWLITDLNFQGILNPEVLSAAGLEYQGEYRLAKAAGFQIRMGRLTINRPVGLMAPVRPPASRAESCQEKRNIFNSERSAPRQNSPEAAPPE